MKVKVGPTAAADCPPISPLAAVWRSPLLRLKHDPQVTKSHKKSQKVTKSHHESLAANNSAVTVPQPDGNYLNASPEKRHSSSLSRTPPAVASHSRVMSKSQNDTRVISKILNDLKGHLRILFSSLWFV